MVAMSEQIIADISRDNATIFTGIPMELHFSVDLEMHSFGGITPFYRYLCIVWQLIDIHQNDYLVGVKRIDPLTGQLVAWLDNAGAANTIQVVSRPERLPDSHIEFHGDDRRTTGFS
jgi:hypothetical protein